MASTVTHRLIAALRPPVDAAGPVGDPAELALAAEQVGHGAVSWAVAMSQDSFQLVLDHVTGNPAPHFVELLRRAIERAAIDLLLALDGHDQPVALNADQLAIVQDMAQREVPFERIINGLRIVQQHWTDVVLAHVEQHRPARERTTVLREIMNVLPTFFDATVNAVVSDYLFERQRSMAAQLTNRRAMALSIVGAQPVAEDTAARALGVDLDQHHLAIILWAEAVSGLPVKHGQLEFVARAAANALGAPLPLTVPGEGSTMWAWLSRSQPFTDTYRDAFTSVPAEPVRIAVGHPDRSIGGFRRSHLAARDAHHVAVCADVPAPVTTYHDVGLVALLSSDPERAGWFVAEELGPLAANDPATTDLRATLLSYLDSGCSLVAAAAALHVHRNTIVYRLRRIQQLLGRPVTERTQQLHAALTLAATLGSPVLRRAVT